MRDGAMTGGNGGLQLNCISSVVAMVAVLAPTVCWAEPWTLGGGLTQQFEYDDNALGSIQNEEGAWGSRTIPAIELERRTELTTLRLGGSVEIVRYPELSRLHSENYHVDGEARHRRERSEYALNLSYDDESANDREVDLDTPLAPDVRQQTFSARPFFSYALTERNTVEVPLNYSHVAYDAPGVGGAVGATDYDRYGVNVNMTQRFDERSTGVIGVLFDHYIPETTGEHIGYGATVGWRYDYTPQLQLSAGVGVERIEPQDGTGDSDVGLLLNAGATYRPELGQLDLTYTRSFEPTVRGGLREVDSVRLRGTTTLDERTGVEAAVAYLQGTEDNVNANGSQIFEASAALTYAIWEDVALRPSYRFQYQEYDAFAGDVTSNLVMLGIVWTAPRQSF